MASIAAWYAARLWFKASVIEMPDYDPPLASMDDNPSIHILGAVVQLNQAQLAIAASGQLNAQAAKWAAFSALLTGLTIIAGVI